MQEFVGVKGIPVAVGIPNLLDMFKDAPPIKRSFSKTPSILISHPITSATASSHFDSSKMDAEGSAATRLSHGSYSSLLKNLTLKSDIAVSHADKLSCLGQRLKTPPQKRGDGGVL